MDTRKNFDGGEIGITNDEIDLMPKSNREGLNGINEGIGSGANMIISGVGAVIDPGVDVTVSDGFVFLNGEMLKVDAQVIPRTAGTDLYQFEKVVTNNIAEWDRDYRDATTHNVYEKNRAVPTNVAAITGLSVVGDTMTDVLKGLIQVQTDWDQLDNGQPDYLKNKPTIVTLLLQGKVNDVTVGGAMTPTVEGGFSSVSVLNSSGDDSRIRVTFPSIGTSDYHPLVTIESKAANWDDDNDVYCQVKNLTNTTFEILLKEQSTASQDLTLLVTILPF